MQVIISAVHSGALDQVGHTYAQCRLDAQNRIAPQGFRPQELSNAERTLYHQLSKGLHGRVTNKIVIKKGDMTVAEVVVIFGLLGFVKQHSFCVSYQSEDGKVIHEVP